jgi:hypothetical protein
MKPLARVQLPATVWKIRWDAAGQLLGLEVRDAARHETTFAAVDLNTGTLAWQGLQGHDPWWVGLEDCLHGWLVLHGYTDPGMPTHKGIACYDAAARSWAFKHPALNFEWGTANGLLVSEDKDGAKQYYELTAGPSPQLAALATGQALELLEVPDARRYHTQTPVAIEASQEPFKNMAQQLQRITGHEAVMQLELLQMAGTSILAYYTALPQGQWVHHLGIFKQGAMLYSDVLEAQTALLNAQPFVVLQNQLVYVQEKTQLVIVNL